MSNASERSDDVLLEQLEQDFGKQAIVNRRRTTSRGGSAMGGEAGMPLGQVAQFPQGMVPPQGPQAGGQAVLNNAPAAGEGGAEPAAAPRGRPDTADQRFGLSLPLDILEVGQKRTFHRSEGAPRLALSFRNRESTELIWKLLWTLLWLAEAALLCWLVMGGGGWSVPRRVGWALTSLGVVWVLLCAGSAWGLIPLLLGLALLMGFKEQPTVGDHEVATDRR
jgi:hypothetical protein